MCIGVCDYSIVAGMSHDRHLVGVKYDVTAYHITMPYVFWLCGLHFHNHRNLTFVCQE